MATDDHSDHDHADRDHDDGAHDNSHDHSGHDHQPSRRRLAGGGHGHSHDHGQQALRAGERHKGRLLFAFCLLAVFMVVELVAGIITGSLALLSDAGHMITDVAGLGMALAAIQLAGRGSERSSRTFGLYRLEILAALANSLLLFGVAGYVLVEAIRRFDDAPEIHSTSLLVVATLGLIANLVAFWLLREGSKESINVEGAYLEVLADTIGSVGVIIGAIAIGVTGWTWIDPVIGVAIGLWVIPRTWRLASRAVRILIQAAPDGMDMDELRTSLSALTGVVDVHDLHAWTLTSDMEVVSAHLMVNADADAHSVLDQARDVLRSEYGIDHATLQVEPHDHTGCADVTW